LSSRGLFFDSTYYPPCGDRDVSGHRHPTRQPADCPPPACPAHPETRPILSLWPVLPRDGHSESTHNEAFNKRSDAFCDANIQPNPVTQLKIGVLCGRCTRPSDGRQVEPNMETGWSKLCELPTRCAPPVKQQESSFEVGRVVGSSVLWNLLARARGKTRRVWPVSHLSRRLGAAPGILRALG
jgi:hypothetical protein